MDAAAKGGVDDSTERDVAAELYETSEAVPDSGEIRESNSGADDETELKTPSKDDKTTAASTTATSPHQPFRFWRKYPYLYLPLMALIPFVPWSLGYLARPSSNATDVLIAIPGFSLFAWFVASKIYPSKPPDPQPKDKIPWSRRSHFYRLISNIFYNFVTGRSVSPVAIIFDTFWSSGVFLLFGQAPKTTQTPFRELVSCLIGLVGTIVLKAIVPITALASFFDHLDRVNRRVFFISFVDLVISFLAFPPRGKYKMALVYATQTAIMLSCVLLLSVRTPFVPLWACSSYEQLLITKWACYDSIRLDDPQMFYKQATCRDLGGLNITFPDTTRRLLDSSDKIAGRCADSLNKQIQMACYALAPVQEFDVLHTLGYCVEEDKALDILRQCGKKYRNKSLVKLLDLAEKQAKLTRESERLKVEIDATLDF